MLTQHTPRIPHRPALPHGTAAIVTLIVMILVLVLGIFLAFQALRPVTPRVETPKVVASVPIDQAVIGQHTIVTGMIFDGSTYRSVPVAVAVGPGPAIGQHTIVTGMIFDGSTYRSAPVAVAVGPGPTIGQHMIVTAMIFDGTRYRSAPVVIGTPNAIHPNGLPMRDLVGSVYSPSQFVPTKVTYSTGSPMKHLAGSVYELR